MTAITGPGWTGKTVGIFGGGQLGRMVALEGRRLGIKTWVLDPDPHCPAGQVADHQIVASYSDRVAARELASRTDVITYEFEHIDAEVVADCETRRPVYPGSKVLAVIQHRLRQKEALFGLGFPLPRFCPVETWEDLEQGLSSLGMPTVLKTATSGYDGKGQIVIRQETDARSAYESLSPRGTTLVLEEFVNFDKELSVLCARERNGGTICYPVMENVHCSGILDITMVPARVDAAVAASAQQLALDIAQRMGVIGLLCVEMFLTCDGRLLVNELAPRPHNSAHYTLDAALTSQFEQLLRVLCGLPLGSAELISPAVMVNLLGDVWLRSNGKPDFASALAVPGVKLHLYGKLDTRPGRKMGHLCILGPTIEIAMERASAARAALMASK
jgi:5-(carboxyamino)imidazole ribonucleotide synthase